MRRTGSPGQLFVSPLALSMGQCPLQAPPFVVLLSSPQMSGWHAQMMASNALEGLRGLFDQPHQFKLIYQTHWPQDHFSEQFRPPCYFHCQLQAPPLRSLRISFRSCIFGRRGQRRRLDPLIGLLRSPPCERAQASLAIPSCGS